MGEIAEMMLEGIMCEACGEWLDGEGEGIPRYCSESCARDRHAEHSYASRAARSDKTSCPTCFKRVKVTGLADHQRDVHRASQ